MVTRRRKRCAGSVSVALVISILATWGVAPSRASVEDGRRRIDVQFPAAGDQEVGGIAVAEDGTVFVAGSTDGDFGGQVVGGADDALLYATNQSGEIEWAVVEDGDDESAGNEFEFFNDVIVHSNGDIYVVGQINGDGGDNGSAVISRYSADGELVQPEQVLGDSPDIEWDEAQSLVEGPDGNIYVVGYTGDGILGNPVRGDHDAFVVRFDEDLLPVSAYLFGNLGDDRAYSIDVDLNGDFYIGGRTDDTDFNASPNPGSTWDWFVLKVDVSEDEIEWSTFGGDTGDEGGDDRIWDVRYSPIDDSVWAVGYRGLVEYDPVGHPGLFVKDGVILGLDASTGDVDPLVINTYVDSEFRSVSIDSRGHPIVTWSIDGDNTENVENSAGILQGGMDSGLTHNPGFYPVDYWDDYITTASNDEVFNSVFDSDDNLWLVGTTEGDLASTNGGGTDIFLSLYRARDHRRSRSSTSVVPWSTTSGTDRFDSAVVASQSGPTGGTVILVDGRNVNDVLAASMLDSVRDHSQAGRVLFTAPGATDVPDALRLELERISPSSITIVGDELAVTSELARKISALGLPEPSRVAPPTIVDRIIGSATPTSALVLSGNQEPTTVLQAVSWSNAIDGSVLPFDAALFELDRLRSVGFGSLVVVGDLDPLRRAALSVIESSLGLVARTVTDPTPGELSLAMASTIGSRPDVAFVSPSNWLDAVHANSFRLPIVWAGPDCLQVSASSSLIALGPTRSIRGFGGAMAGLGDPRTATRC